jgi:hypothetical protein
VIIREQVCKLRSKSVYVHIRDPQRKYSGYVVGMLSRRFASILEEYHATLLRLHAARQCEDAGGVEAALSSATQQLQEAVSTASYRVSNHRAPDCLFCDNGKLTIFSPPFIMLLGQRAQRGQPPDGHSV